MWEPKNLPPFRERMVNLLARLISHRAGWVLFGTVVFVGFFSAFLPQLKPRNNSYDFIVDRDPATDYFNRFRAIFEKDEFFVIAYRQEDLFSPARLKDLKSITEALESLDNVTDVVSLANVADMRGTEDSFEADDFLRHIPSTSEGLAALRRRGLANPLYHRTLLSNDGTTTAIVVFTHVPSFTSEPDFDVDKAMRGLMDSVHRILAPYQKKGVRFAIAGWPVTTFYMGKYMFEDASLFFPISLVLTLGTIWFVFRNRWLFLLACAGIGSTLFATLGLAGLANIPINNASVAVIPLVMALALSDIIHVFTHLDRRFLNENGGSPKKALEQLLRTVLFPCLLTSINTGIGFFSFTFNNVAAMRSFGWLASIGMMFEFVVTFGMVAPLLVFIKPESVYRETEQNTQREIPRFLRWTHRNVTRRPLAPFLICFAAMAVSAWFARTISVDTNLEKLFPPAATLRQDIDFVRTNMAGMESINVVFESDPETFKNPDMLSKVEALKRDIEAHPRIHSVSGFGDYLKEMNKAFHAESPSEYRLPHSQRMLEQYLLLYGRDDLDDYVTPRFDVTRLMVRANAQSSNESRAVIEDIEAMIRRHPMPGVRCTVTGGTVLGVRTMKVMVDDQIKNIGQTVIVIWLIMLAVLRSWGLSLLFLVPNLFPIAINFGLMGLLGIPLDSGTSLIAASAFGIIVDDTVHFFVAFQQRRKRGLSVAQSLEETSFEKGEAAVSSFLIMGIAFGVLVLSHFMPIKFFGLLNMLILIVGLVGDQVFLKSILALWGRRADGPQPVSPGCATLEVKLGETMTDQPPRGRIQEGSETSGARREDFSGFSPPVVPSLQRETEKEDAQNLAQQIIACYETLSLETLNRLEDIYAPTCFFKDPFVEIRDIGSLIKYYEHMFKRGLNARFKVTARVAETHRISLYWVFTYERFWMEWEVRGSFFFELGPDGRIVKHEDYWDVSAQIYERLPVVGIFFRWLKRWLGSLM